jgi:competence protein ComEC
MAIKHLIFSPKCNIEQKGGNEMAIPGNNKLRIFILNVGQADTSVIITPKGNIIIIDAVKPSKVLSLLNDLGLQNNGEIEKLIITHPHLDHYSGANRILNDFKVKSVSLAPFWNAFGMGSPTYRSILNAVEREGSDLDFISGYARYYPDGALELAQNVYDFNLDAFYIEILGPPNSLISQLERDSKLDTNHLSIISRLRWKNKSFLFAGDAQMENWAYFDSEGMLSENCSLIKTAHHGSCNGTQLERLNRLKPEYVFISSDPQGIHSLPDLVGSSIFAKYEVNNSRNIVAITSETGSILVTVSDTGAINVERFSDLSEDNISFANRQTLNWENNPTNWQGLLQLRSNDLYH